MRPRLSTHLVPGAADNGREHGARRIVARKAGLAHAGAVVDHQRRSLVTHGSIGRKEKREGNEREKKWNEGMGKKRGGGAHAAVTPASSPAPRRKHACGDRILPRGDPGNRGKKMRVRNGAARPDPARLRGSGCYVRVRRMLPVAAGRRRELRRGAAAAATRARPGRRSHAGTRFALTMAYSTKHALASPLTKKKQHHTAFGPPAVSTC